MRYVVKDGGDPVAPGTGIYVHNPKQKGKSYYAVTTALNGEEDLTKLATAGPVSETVGPGEPVLQFVKKPGEYEHHYYQKKATLHYYTRWEAPPRCNLPSRPIDYIVGILPNIKPPSPLALRLHGWGGSMHGGGFWTFPHLGTIMVSTNQIPYDWWTGYHEYANTWKSWRDGVVKDYTQQRLLGIVDWVDTKWKVDMTRVSVGGGSMGGSGTTNLAVHHWKRIAWAAGSVGVHIPDSSPQFTSSYIHSYGRVEWQLPYKDIGVSAFNWFSNEWYVLNHPKAEIGLVCFSNGKNDGQIGWPQALRFARAMQKMRQPHLFKWGMGGHGEGVKVPECAAGVRTDRTLPAFTNCSLDEDPGKGIRKPREQYEREKKEIKEWNKKNPHDKKRADHYDGASHGMFNGYMRWDTDDENIVDEPDRWSMIIHLYKGGRRKRHAAPKPECTVDITPRRCQKFKPEPGDKFRWTNYQHSRLATGGDPWTKVQTGTAEADKWGLVTMKAVKVTKLKNKVVLEKVK
jgi:pimeloyl-ACP methyl ester carboxylesterase